MKRDEPAESPMLFEMPVMLCATSDAPAVERADHLADHLADVMNDPDALPVDA